MSKFTYTLPSGKKFVVNGPNGATQIQADKIFYEQVASGSLVGFEPGDVLTGDTEELVKFGLSRLDRGTAGVSDETVLAIVSGIPISVSVPIIDNTNANTAGANNQVVIRPSLINVPIVNPITQEDVAVVTDGIGPNAIGPLSPTEVQAIDAQKINIVEQDYRVITQEKGIGKYGFNCIQLEKTGYVKPSTSQIYLKVTVETQPNPSNFVSVMSSPSIWTGKNGVTSLDDILSNKELQTQLYHELMAINDQALVETVIIKEKNTTASDLTVEVEYTNTSVFSQTLNMVNNTVMSDTGALLNLSATYGPQAATSWAQGGTVANPSVMDSLAKSSMGAVNFAINFLSGLVSGVKSAFGYAQTVDRSTVDAATTRVIGNAKIPSPTFTPQAAANELDIGQAQRLLNEAKTAGQDAINRITR
jgi:hypothetical protein